MGCCDEVGGGGRRAKGKKDGCDGWGVMESCDGGWGWQEKVVTRMRGEKSGCDGEGEEGKDGGML